MMIWIGYIIGTCCIIWSLLQTRTVLVYMGVLKSAVIPEFAVRPIGLIHSAMQDALSFLVYGALFFIFAWPKIITYVLFALLFKACVNLVLALLGVGRFGIAELTPKGKAYQVVLETVPLAFYFVSVWLSAHFLGY